MKRKKDKKKEKTDFVGPPNPDKKRDEPREHHWTYAEILWTYRYTMVAAIHTQQGPFGEAPWLIPLLERAGIVLNIKEVGGDKAYDANYNYRYAKERDIDAQIKIRRGHDPVNSNLRKKFRKHHIEASRVDPEGFAARANRRNNAETGNHAFKAILGDQIYSKKAIGQRNEILCMCIAYNLTRLTYLGVERGIDVRFNQGAQALSQATWVPLDTLRQLFPGNAKPRPEWSGE